jgi:hypothetical protein
LKTAGRKENKPLVGDQNHWPHNGNKNSGDYEKVFSVPVNPSIFDRRWSFMH